MSHTDSSIKSTELDQSAIIEHANNEAYFAEYKRRVDMLTKDQKIAEEALELQIKEALDIAAIDTTKRKENAKYIGRNVVALGIAGAMFFISSTALIAAYPLWQAIILVAITGFTTKGFFRFVDNEEMLMDFPYPWTPVVELFKMISDKKNRKTHWENLKQSLPQVTGALLVGYAIAKATFLELSTTSAFPLPVAIVLATAIGLSNYAMGAYSFGPDSTVKGKQVSFWEKAKDYWHTFQMENAWERNLRVMGHMFCLAAGVALTASLVAGTGGAFGYVLLAAGIVQGIGLQRTGIPHFFVRMGATVLKPLGIKIHTPPTATELAWEKAPTKVKLLTRIGAVAGFALTSVFLVKAFVGLSVLASIGFPPLAAGIVTAAVLGILSYQMMQRFYFRKLDAKKQAQFKEEAEKAQKDALLARGSKEVVADALEPKKEAPALGWTASPDSIITDRLSHVLDKQTSRDVLVDTQRKELRQKALTAKSTLDEHGLPKPQLAAS